MENALHFDFIVVGGGSAGYAAARTAHGLGQRVAVVDSASELGGLCILRGCMPSKTLLHTAEILHQAQHAADLGLAIPAARADMAAVQQRKRRIIAEFAQYRQEQLADGRFTLFREKAAFVGEDRLRLSSSGRELTADHFLIATGSIVNTPPIPGLRETPHWTSDDILELDFLPESVIVLGGGIVACELAQFLQRMGSAVTQIQRSPAVLRDIGRKAAEVIMQTFRDEGIALFVDTRIESVTALPEGGVEVAFHHADSGSRKVRAAHLFNALGRRPATDSLGLEQAGIELAPSGHIRTDSSQRTTNPRVFAAGDCAGPHEIVHVAILQGELAARTACGVPTDPVDYDLLTAVVFTDPPIATVGLSAEAAAARGLETLQADYPFDDHGKSITMNATRGYVEVLAEKSSGRVLGATCVGAQAGELIHAMAVAVTLRATTRELLRAHWYHPTLSEIWTYPLEEIEDARSL